MTNSAPTSKQLAYIASLLGIRDNAYCSTAYMEIGRDMGISGSKAAKKASAADASRTIDRLKKAA